MAVVSDRCCIVRGETGRLCKQTDVSSSSVQPSAGQASPAPPAVAIMEGARRVVPVHTSLYFPPLYSPHTTPHHSTPLHTRPHHSTPHYSTYLWSGVVWCVPVQYWTADCTATTTQANCVVTVSPRLTTSFSQAICLITAFC